MRVLDFSHALAGPYCTLLLAHYGATVYKLELATGHKQLWKQLVPPDVSGVTDISAILITPDGNNFVYEYGRTLSDLYLVNDLK